MDVKLAAIVRPAITIWDAKKNTRPFGIVDEAVGPLYIHFGSSYKTSDFIVDTLAA